MGGSSGATNTSSTSSNSTSGQSIIDGLLFGGSKDSISGQPSAGVSASSTASSVAKTGAAGISTSSGMSTPSMDNLFSLFTGSSSSSSPSTSSGNGAITPKILGGMPSFFNNVWITRAAREMGCKFMSEMLELDLGQMGTMLDCTDKCVMMMPFIKPVKNGP